MKNGLLFFASLVGGCLLLTPAHGDPHPADADQNFSIDIHEITAYAALLHEGGATLPEYQQARFIWQQGERYRHVSNAPSPMAWAPAPLTATPFAVLAISNIIYPLDFVALAGLPADVSTNLYIEYQVPYNPKLYYSAVEDAGTNEWQALMPLVPGSADGGGTIWINLRDGTNTIPVGYVTLAGLPSASGTTATMVNDLNAIGDLIGQLAGVQLANYRSAHLSTVPLDIRPFALADRILFDPANPNNLSQVLLGTAPVLNTVGDYQQDLADRIWARTGFDQALHSMRTGLAATVTARGITATSLSRSAPWSTLARSPSTDSSFPVASLSELSALMKEQCSADFQTDANSPAGRAKAGFGYVTAAISLMGPVGAAFALGAGATSFVIDTYQQGVASVLPSTVPTFELLLDQSVFVEDDCGRAKWDVYMSAKSKGWSLAKPIVQALFTAGSAARGVRGLSDAVSSSEPLKNLTDDLADGVELVAGQSINEFFEGESTTLTISPSNWDNISVTDTDIGLVEVTYPGDVVQEVLGLPRDYEPAAVGNGFVQVSTKAGVLGCAAAMGQSEPVEVRENQILVSPGGGEVEPGTIMDFTATTVDMEHKEVVWSVTGGTILSETHDTVNGVHTLRWQAPAEDDFPSVIIKATSTTTFCLRDGVTRENAVFVSPETVNYILSPDLTCMQNGGDQTFELINLEFGPVSNVSWSMTGPGSLIPDGPSAGYTAAGEGDVTITATLTDSGDSFTQSFTVGDCQSANFIIYARMTNGWDNGVAGTLQIDDNDALDTPEAVWLTERYAIDGNLFVESITNDVITGDYIGLGAVLKYPEAFYTDPNYDTGERTYPYTENGVETEITLSPGIALREIDRPVGASSAVEYIGAGRLKVFLRSSSTTSGSTNDIERFEWDMGDGTQLTGSEIEHIYDVGSRYDYTVSLTIVDQRGNAATHATTLRLIDFIINFEGPFTPGIPAFCMDVLAPGTCPSALYTYGPRSGQADANFIQTSPVPPDVDLEPGYHALNIIF